MRSKLFSQFILLTILLFITACSDTIDYNEDTESYIETATETFSYTQTVEGVEFKVGFDKESYTVGEDITVTVLAKNVSGKNLDIWSLTDDYGKLGAISVDSYIDEEMSYISNSRDLADYANEYVGVLENKESIRCRITFYTDTIYSLTEEDYLEFHIYLGVTDENGERDTVGIMVPVDILFD